MLSKFWRNTFGRFGLGLFKRNVIPRVQKVSLRRAGEYLPRTQYDVPVSKRFTSPMYVITKNWEVIPLLIIVVGDCALMLFATYWCIMHKVDVTWKTHSRRNISNTMDLRHPTAHKLILINQVYEPWPEMQNVRDKMWQAKKQLKNRSQACVSDK